jgi:hypothetical protein
MARNEASDPGLERFMNERVQPILDRLRGHESERDLRIVKTVVYEVETAESLIAFFDRHPMFRAPGGIEARATGTNRFIFRGQGDYRWPLLPSSLRWSEAELDHVRGLEPAKRTTYVKDQLIEELIAVKDFLLLAASLGFDVPIGPEQLFEYIFPIEAAALSGKMPELPPLPGHVLDAMALAQHHGVGTRLLDWTESPYIAAFFAAFEWSSVGQANGKDAPEWMVVHCLNQARLGSYPRIKAYIPQRHNKDFIRAQRGMFIHFSAVLDRSVESCHWPTLEEIIEDENDRILYVNTWPALVSLKLRTRDADAMLRLLYNRHVSRATVMPNLDNIARDRSYVQRLLGD